MEAIITLTDAPGADLVDTEPLSARLRTVGPCSSPLPACSAADRGVVCASCETRARGGPGAPTADRRGSLLGTARLRRCRRADHLAEEPRSTRLGHLVRRSVGHAGRPGRRPCGHLGAHRPRRRRARGYDQAELLARALARRWALPCTGLLVRRPGPPQAGRSGGERRANPSFVPARACPSAILLVDDVVTTGCHLEAPRPGRCARGAPPRWPRRLPRGPPSPSPPAGTAEAPPSGSGLR